MEDTMELFSFDALKYLINVYLIQIFLLSVTSFQFLCSSVAGLWICTQD